MTCAIDRFPQSLVVGCSYLWRLIITLSFFTPQPPDQSERRGVLLLLQYAGQVGQKESQIGIVAAGLAAQQESFAEFVLRR
jgi:hypothetical protein